MQTRTFTDPGNAAVTYVPENAENVLVQRCLEGQSSAWARLHQIYSPATQAYLRNLGVPNTEVEDACQEVFLQIYRSLGSFRHESALKSWIYRLCLTHAHRARRKVRLRSSVTRELTTLHEYSAPLAELELSDESAARAVASALSRLSERERRVLVLHAFEGLGGQDIASQTNITLPNVWRILHYARRRFKDLLEGQSDGLASFTQNA